MTSPRPPYGRRPQAATVAGPPLKLGHLVPERRPVVVARPNPDYLALDPDDDRRDRIPEMVDVILQGYLFGDRCPGVVKAELASIEETYLRALSSASAETQGGGDDPAAGIATGAAASVFVSAWHTFMRETIQALVPGLTPGEADVLAAVPPGGEGIGTDLLRYLGVWRRADQAADDGGDGDPEADGGAGQTSTTAPSSPISPPSTDSDPPIS